MITVLYDGSFYGLLQIVYDSYHKKINPQKIVQTSSCLALFDEVEEIFTNENESQKVLLAIKEKLGGKALQNIKNAFLHDSRPLEIEIFHYIKLGFKNPKQLNNQTIECVKTIDDAVLSISRERHKYLGFVRFQRLDDESYYAAITPLNNILPLLASHFVERLKDQRFIIHDRKRKIALVYDLQSLQIYGVSEFEELPLHEEEAKFVELWRGFFKTIAISEMGNKNLQKQFVPLRYRDFMIEFG